MMYIALHCGWLGEVAYSPEEKVECVSNRCFIKILQMTTHVSLSSLGKLHVACDSEVFRYGCHL